MYKKTLGLFVIALMAISVSGVVYANLCVGFEMYHDIYTGCVKIGILNTGTSDPEGTNDLVWDGSDFVRTHKDVAMTTSDNIDPKCQHDDVCFYDKVFFNISDAYPWYVAYENFTIANCGTIPVFITSIDLVEVNSTDPCNMLNEVMIWGYLTVNGQEYGPMSICDLPGRLAALQLDPCNTVDISIWILFLQDVPLDCKATFEVEITACQWNEVLFPPQPE